VVCIIRLLPTQSLHYGKGQVTFNSVILLIYGIYCFAVSSSNLICVQRLWMQNSGHWKRKMASAYGSILFFAASLAFLMSVNNHIEFQCRDILYCLIFVSPAFLFPIGLVLLALGFNGVFYSRNRPKFYLVITFLASLLFSLGGTYPALIVITFWVEGGFSM
jgi:hypothetical protein